MKKYTTLHAYVYSSIFFYFKTKMWLYQIPIILQNYILVVEPLQHRFIEVIHARKD